MIQHICTRVWYSILRWKNSIENLTLRIQICSSERGSPHNPITCGWDFSTINPTRSGGTCSLRVKEVWLRTVFLVSRGKLLVRFVWQGPKQDPLWIYCGLINIMGRSPPFCKSFSCGGRGKEDNLFKIKNNLIAPVLLGAPSWLLQHVPQTSHAINALLRLSPSITRWSVWAFQIRRLFWWWRRQRKMLLVVWKCPTRDLNQVCVENFCGVYPFSQNHGVITLIERKLILKGPIFHFHDSGRTGI